MREQWTAFQNLGPTSSTMQFIRLDVTSSKATEGFILVFHIHGSTPQDR